MGRSKMEVVVMVRMKFETCGVRVQLPWTRVYNLSGLIFVLYSS